MTAFYKHIYVSVLLTALLWVTAPMTVSAHSQVESSNPADGETVEESLDTMTIEFSGGIEAASALTLFNEADEEIPLTVTVEDSTLMAQSEQPLANGNYRAVYSIMSEDTHPVDGEISFTVQAEETGEEQTETPPVEEEQEDPVEAPDQETADSEERSSGSSILWIFLFVGVVGMMSGFMMNRKKRKS